MAPASRSSAAALNTSTIAAMMTSGSTLDIRMLTSDGLAAAVEILIATTMAPECRFGEDLLVARARIQYASPYALDVEVSARSRSTIRGERFTSARIFTRLGADRKTQARRATSRSKIRRTIAIAQAYVESTPKYPNALESSDCLREYGVSET